MKTIGGYMWKYRCKSQLIALLLSFIVGVLLTYVSFSSNPTVFYQLVPSNLLSLVKEYTWFFPLVGGFSLSGFANVIILSQWAQAQFNLNPIFIMLLVFLSPDFVFSIAAMLVIPVAILCIYGWISLKLETSGQLKQSNINEESEIFRIYQIHHKIHPEMKSLADECRKNELRVNLIYALGVLAIIVVFMFIRNIWVLVIVFVVYTMIFRFLLEYRASVFIPIASLLYEDCNPEACVSAIYYYSMRGKKVSRIKQHTLLAQCLIYLNEPELAEDVLILYPKKDQASILTYWSLMGYIQYMLKNEFSLQRCFQEASNVDLKFGKTGITIQNEEVMSIQNRIHLMNGELNVAKKYYLHNLKNAHFLYQKVDSYYYIALISFVEEDYSMANVYFRKVVEQGNQLYFVDKARTYIEKLEHMGYERESLL